MQKGPEGPFHRRRSFSEIALFKLTAGKAFRYRMVMAVATSTHAAKQVVGFQEVLPATATELTTLV